MVGYKQHSTDIHKAYLKLLLLIYWSHQRQVSAYLQDEQLDQPFEHYVHTGLTKVSEEGLCQEAAKIQINHHK